MSARHWPMLVSLLAALSLEVAPLPPELSAWRPPWVALVAVYWALSYPRRYGLAMAWAVGLVLDVLKGSVLGQHALAMTVTIWIALYFHLRLRVFPPWQQTMAVVGMVFVHQFLVFWVDGVTSAATLDWRRLAPVAAAALAWPVLAALLDHLRVRLRMQT
ncbi:rod shape-determining protein MreD [Thioalkalivibrio sp. XN8]|uniref:rod shape-determining protein MreD n=1 Tax=Thioalkalivibrio sp. XN8 TaxID=2712863 RepID=UPI0013EBB6A0|nr:rod shape-determining protein MreD [Thioalkalivibrio sp. XN8]